MSSERYISENDILDSNSLCRAFAIILVVMCHLLYAGDFWKFLGPTLNAGKIGVSIFVFYSGFLMQYQSIRQKKNFSVSNWLLRRARRIYPTFWMGLAITLFVGTIFLNRSYTCKMVFANITGIHAFLNIHSVSSGFAGPYWFISLILLCYLAFLLLRNFRRKGLLALIFTPLSLLVIYLMHRYSLTWPVREIPRVFPVFIYGMWGAEFLHIKHKIVFRRWINMLLTILLLGIAWISYKLYVFVDCSDVVLSYLRLIGPLCLNFGSISLIGLMVYAHKIVKLYTPKTLTFIYLIGNLSYAIYCTHEPILIILSKLTASGHPIIGLLTYSLTVLGVSLIVNYLAEVVVKNVR